MKKCVNCNGIIRNSDIYCRNCGIKIEKNWYYVFVNIGITLLSLAILFIIVMLIAAFFMN